MEIVEWLETNFISYEKAHEKLFVIDDILYIILSPKDKIINQDFNVVPTPDELELLDQFPESRLAFYFGNNWYWTSPEGETKFNPLRYLGRADLEHQEIIPFLGIHGKFELLNGSRDYSDWCKKAKFLGIDTLAIVEQQTLAGTMLFQEICEEHEIKSIIGHTAVVTNETQTYKVKLYVKNKIGWRNLLKINKYQNVDNVANKTIPESELMKYSEGLVCVLNPEVELVEWLVKKYDFNFNEVYYSIDLTSWSGEPRDKKWLSNIQAYLTHFRPYLKPVLINDAYYLDSIDKETKMHLNKIGKVKDQYLSKDQYFKNIDELVSDFYTVFEQNSNSENLIVEAIKNTQKIGEICDFKINTKSRYLPRYKMTEEENNKFEDNEHLFHYLVLEGFERKIQPKLKGDEKINIYLDRIQEESEVLIEGNVADYFLILSDICNWSRRNGVLVGHGRGSAGGSLISYLLNITEIDPIEYNLLFSRFLTKGRLKGSLPDIDVDFSDRDRVVQYMKQKYGENYVASVGTFGNLKVKNAIKDFGRNYGSDPKATNYITGFIKKDYEAADFTKVIEFASREKRFKKFVTDYPKIFQFFDILLHQTRTASIHACATVVVPDVDEEGLLVDIHDFIPTKLMDGQLVTEWEGAQLEKAGFLKEDILGLKQLEKFDAILKLIKENHNEEIDIYQIDLEQEEVFEKFREGNNEDIFQFGSDGLKGYCKFMKPDSVEELTAANALYRPGAMESNAHMDFGDIKFGRKEPDYDFLLEEVTKKTYGLYIYQEQIMQAYAIITDVDLEQADKFRKYITKAYKLKSKGIVDTEYIKYEKEFIEKYINKGQKENLAQAVWDKLVAFASYGFNRSHAAAYAIISYISQWFKVNYPVEFWTTSLNEASDDDRPKRLAEIDRSSNINIFPVDVNKSELSFKGSVEDQAIYWALSSVKQLGEKAASVIIEERDKNGGFFSIEEFISRVPKRQVNKRLVTNLILSGGFDQIHKVNLENERFYILDKFYAAIKEEHEIDKFIPHRGDKIWWQITQTELTGFGGISYDTLIKRHKYKEKYITDLQEEKIDSYVCIAGTVVEFKVKNSPKVGDFAIILVNCNNKSNPILVWNESFEAHREELLECDGKIILINGKVGFDKFNSQNSLYSNRTTKIVVI